MKGSERLLVGLMATLPRTQWSFNDSLRPSLIVYVLLLICQGSNDINIICMEKWDG